tara:strand:- start:42 stop:287 length:246 start_codon:yes stop_codon:yes gene_type:complete
MADKNTIVTHHADGTTTTEVVDWTPEQLAAHAEAEANAWKGAREVAYPSWQDQLDNIYHNGIDAWKADIKAIKDKYPKGDV